MTWWAAVWQRKRFWLMPLIVFALLIAALIAISGGDVLKPFKYDRL